MQGNECVQQILAYTYHPDIGSSYICCAQEEREQTRAPTHVSSVSLNFVAAVVANNEAITAACSIWSRN